MNTNDLERIVTEIAETVGERQGWSVFSCYGSERLGDGLAVQRIDDAEILDSDDDAIRLARAAGINCDDEGRVIGLHPMAEREPRAEEREVKTAIHTPGPWTIHAWGDADYEVLAADDACICNVPYAGDQDHDERHDVIEANARLIAASPEMLKALQFILPTLRAAAACGNHRDSDGINLLLEAADEAERAVKIATEGGAA